MPDDLRRRLSLSPTLGAGNFLHCAHLVNEHRDTPLLHTSDDVVTADGSTRRSFSISQLKNAADGAAAWYFERGIRPMDPVAVFCQDGLQHLIQYVALTALGAIPVLMNGALEPSVAAGYLHGVGVVGVLTDHHRAAVLERLVRPDALRFLARVEEVRAPEPARLPDHYPFEHTHDDPVLVTHSSGTTGAPKAIVLTNGGWFHGIRHLLGLESAEGADRYLSAIPPSHNAAIAYAIHAVLTGASIMVVSRTGGEHVAADIERFRPSSVAAFPTTYVDLAELPDRDFSSVTTWINSGDAAHESHIRRLIKHGYHHRSSHRIDGSQFVDCLGSSEMGHALFRAVHTPYTDNYERCVGVPQEWVDAVVLDRDGRRLSAGEVGRLAVRTPSITAGYWNDSSLTYRSRLQGYWLTGDVVYRDWMGCYHHLDRSSDVIPTETGPLYSLQTEELILKHEEDVADCTVVGINPGDAPRQIARPVALAVPRVGRTPDAEEMLPAINQRQVRAGRPALSAVHIVARDEIPVGVTGKVLKRVLRDQLSGGAT
ncbi:class I adenylate-forming enzyme family protein [Streptomyces rishiriensis]|uniref:class I adenylate-forming enzyme family protein n=1 Tax=Streptomyces rishiriensis TaxID=68264 RepID=UPI0033DB1A8F